MQYLKQYLELRIRNGEKINPASPIITALDHNPWKVGQHIRTTNIGDLMRKAIDRKDLTDFDDEGQLGEGTKA